MTPTPPTTATPAPSTSGHTPPTQVPVGATVGDMITLYRRAYAQGRISRSRAANLHAAAARILGDLPDWHGLDVRDPAVREHLRRFASTDAAGLTRMTVNDYASAFASALREFDAYLADPGGWRPTVRRRTPTTPPTTPSATTVASGTRHLSVELPGARLAVLTVPADLTGPEAVGLAGELHTRLTGPAASSTRTTHTTRPAGIADPDQNAEVSR